MKKIILSAIVLTLCLSFSAAITFAHEGEQDDNVPTTASVTKTDDTEVRMKEKEVELKKREAKVSSTTSNVSEAAKNFESSLKVQKQEFQQKMTEAKKQRAACLKERAQDIKNLELERKASVSGMLSTCTPKAIQASMQKPTKPTLDGLTAEEKQAAIQDFQHALKDFNTQVKEALKACKVQITQTQQDFRERMVGLKEQCSNTERSVLGLSTEIPYNVSSSVPMQ